MYTSGREAQEESRSNFFADQEPAEIAEASYLTRNSREVRHSRESQEESDDERTCNLLNKIHTSNLLDKIFGDDFKRDGNSSLNDIDLFSKQQTLLKWLPKWTHHRTVVDLVRKFAQKDKPEVLPLRIVAGGAIRNAVFMAIARVLFSFSFFALSDASVQCNSRGSAQFNWKVWFAWIPFQFLSSVLELISFQIVALPKLMALPEPVVLGFKLPFFVWLAYLSSYSMFGSVNLASDGAFLATQLHAHQCKRGMHFEDTWRQLWHSSLLGVIGADVLVPSYRVTSFVLWTLNLVPIAMALAQGLAFPGSPGVYEIYHDANENTEWIVNYSTPANELRACLTGDQAQTKQNHGAALMCLADVNSWYGVVFDDYEYAVSKAKLLLDEKPEAAAEHVYSQTQRQIQRTVGGAFTNGLQLHLQMTAVAMLKYDEPLDLSNLQSFFSLSVSSIMLWGQIFTAAKVLYKARLWEKKISDSISKKRRGEKPTKTFYLARETSYNNDGESISTWLESLTPPFSTEMFNCRYEKIDPPNLEPDERDYPVTVTVIHTVTSNRLKAMSKAIWYLFLALMVCIVCLGYGAAKFVMLSNCPYSLWNLSGCWVPPGKDESHS